MKTLKLFSSIIVIAAFFCSNTIGQTYQKELHATFDGVPALCGLVISGNWTVHVTYHLDPQTGKIDRMHFNIPKYEIWNTATGARYKLIDSGNDNSGVLWDFFNNLNAYNGVPGMYDVEDGWLDALLPYDYPNKGSYVEMSFKFMGEGHKYLYGAMLQIRPDANGAPTIFKYNEHIDCL